MNYLVSSLVAAFLGSASAYVLVISDRDTLIVLAAICAAVGLAVIL